MNRSLLLLLFVLLTGMVFVACGDSGPNACDKAVDRIAEAECNADTLLDEPGTCTGIRLEFSKCVNAAPQDDVCEELMGCATSAGFGGLGDLFGAFSGNQ